MKLAYQPFNFRDDTAAVIAQAEAICDEYSRQGYSLTLRQLYYRFVAGDLFPESRKWTQVGGRWVRDPNGTKNAEPNYKWLGSIANDGRLAGMIDWYHIVDQGRTLHGPQHWGSPSEIIGAAAGGYAIDKWTTQPRRVEVWVEKDALSQIVDRVAREYDVDSFACKGYVSQSAMWQAARRHLRYIQGGQDVTILHLGDHDPSGVDMTRDIRDRLTMFLGAPKYAAGLTVRRIALTMDQVRQYNPPPNPTKLTDTRAAEYIENYGADCWELDAMEPADLTALIADHIQRIRDASLYQERQREEDRQREVLSNVQDRWAEIEYHWDDVANTLDLLRDED
jgi:hypothetical protein